MTRSFVLHCALSANYGWLTYYLPYLKCSSVPLHDKSNLVTARLPILRENGDILLFTGLHKSTFAAFLLGETSTTRLFLLVLLFREHPKAQPSRRLFLLFLGPGSNLRPLVYKACTTEAFFLG